MVDVFEEVESELRSERYQALAKRLLPWVIAGLLAGILIVAAVIGYQKYQESVANKASDSYAAGLKSLEGGDADGAFAKFGQVPEGAGGYHALALMQQAGIRLAGGNAKQAVELFDKAADAAPKSKIGSIIADAARLKSAFALMDQGSYPEIEARLKPLTEEGRPYRAEAREALALAKLQAGKVKEARQDFVVLSLATDAPESLKNRARTTQQMIDSGLLNNVGAIVKAAAQLKPVATPQLSIPGLDGPPTGQAPAPGAPQ